MSSFKFRFFGLAPVALLCVTFAVSPAKAGVIVYTTAPGATESGGNPVSAEADFTLVGNTITITLKNLFENPHVVAQNLSDLSFTVNSGQTSGTLTSSSGTLRTVASNKTFTDGATVAAGWPLEAGTLKLDDLVGPGHAGPAHTIIGPPAADNKYDAANNSIRGNGPHNPFLAESATFTINLSGEAPTDITSATFSFGTVDGNNVPGIRVVPEPSTIALSGIGCVGLLGFWAAARRKGMSA